MSAAQILRRSAEVYRNAPRYEDQGQLHVRFTHAGAPHDRVLAPASLALERPARLRLRYNSVTLLCDGRQVAAAVEQLPEQVLVRPAPKELSLQVIDQDPVLQAYLGGSESLARKLLESFFLDSGPLLSRLGERAKRLPSAVFEEHPCYRVEVQDGPTRLVYWIDQKDGLIRRLELPSQDWRDLYDPEKQMQDLGVFLELHQARIPEKLDPEQFEAKLPPQAKQVRRFLDRQRPLSPHPLLGKPCPALLLTASDGSKQGPEQWKGETTVLAAWATWCNLCKQALPQLAQAQAKLGANAAVRFRGVNVDESTVSPEQVRAAYEALRVPFEDLLDADQSFRKAFSVEYLPVVLVLDSDGIVQAVEVGHNDQVWAALPERINALRAGKQLFQETLNRHKQEVALYEQALLAANVDDSASTPGSAATDQTPAPASEPQKLGWKALWTCNDVPTPGNVVVVPAAGGEQRLVVLNGVSQAAELDLAGKVLRKIDLATPAGALVTSLRATVSQGKTLFAGYAPGQGRVFIFDGDGKLVLDHGGPASASEMVSRVEWMPQPAGDPLLVLAGYRGYGAQAITIGGDKRWVYRKSEDVLDLAYVPQLRGGELLFTNSKGAAALLDREGRQTAEYFVGKSPMRPLGRLMQFIASADLAGDGTPRWAGIARGEERENVLVGISPDGKEAWDVDLAPGDHLEPIPPLLPLKLAGGAWLAPAPNGVLQFVAADGKLLDRVALGATICGLATLQSGGETWVVVATHLKHENYRLTSFGVTKP